MRSVAAPDVLRINSLITRSRFAGGDYNEEDGFFALALYLIRPLNGVTRSFPERAPPINKLSYALQQMQEAINTGHVESTGNVHRLTLARHYDMQDILSIGAYIERRKRPPELCYVVTLSFIRYASPGFELIAPDYLNTEQNAALRDYSNITAPVDDHPCYQH